MRHFYYLLVVIAALQLAPSATAQDEVANVSEGDEVEAVKVAEEDAVEEEEIDDSDLDEQTYEEDEDDFVPSQEVPTDTPIPFPSNI